MHTWILLAVLHGYVIDSADTTFQLSGLNSCGIFIWWPQGKAFENDRFAECIKQSGRSSAAMKSGAGEKVSCGANEGGTHK